MLSFDEVDDLRRSHRVQTIADEWIDELKSGIGYGPRRDALIRLAIDHPDQALPIVLALIDKSSDLDENICEMIFWEPLEQVVECPDEYVPLLRRAVCCHVGFELYTRDWRLNHGGTPWKRLRTHRERASQIEW